MDDDENNSRPSSSHSLEPPQSAEEATVASASQSVSDVKKDMPSIAALLSGTLQTAQVRDFVSFVKSAVFILTVVN